MQETTLQELVPVETVARLFQQLCFYNRWNISAGIIVAGWDPILGGQVYNVPLGGSKIKVPYAMGGSGSTFLYGWADETWREGMTKDETIAWLRKAVAHAKARDDSSGGNIRTVCISKEGMEHTMTEWNETPFSLEKDTRLKTLIHEIVPFAPTIKDSYKK
eukprot:Sspe_Gene.75559::Locus_47200_Transcript_1_1_Confidence_1.000_Length_935::g.75559::m.75559/K02738/PSMB6; 20S proteasome subunit beta 1